jgi:diketogulonate reductase-like aldo/keto reductase
MKTITLPDGEKVPILGQGTWKMTEEHYARQQEIEALRLGVDLGMTLIDTAEMYGDGKAEELIGEAIESIRDQVFIVSKIYPHNATKTGTAKACERSLKRLKTEYIDLYLLHWRGETKLSEAIEAFELLKKQGKIRRFGVSNFDVSDLEEMNNTDCTTNQVLYNLENRGIEFDLIPWCIKHKMPIMAYAPLSHGGSLLTSNALKEISNRHHATPAQIALAWTIRHDGIISIPKASTLEHVRSNAAAAKIQLTSEDLAILDKAFPPPKKKETLEII